MIKKDKTGLEPAQFSISYLEVLAVKDVLGFTFKKIVRYQNKILKDQSEICII